MPGRSGSSAWKRATALSSRASRRREGVDAEPGAGTRAGREARVGELAEERLERARVRAPSRARGPRRRCPRSPPARRARGRPRAARRRRAPRARPRAPGRSGAAAAARRRARARRRGSRPSRSARSRAARSGRPGRSASGAPSTWSRASPALPGAIVAAPIGERRARRSALPVRSSTEARPRRAGAPGSQRRATSKTVDSRSAPTAASSWPRASSASSTPWRFTAQRTPGATRSAARPKLWSARTRARRPPGWSSTASPTASAPPRSVPVTTAPKPRRSKARSTKSRGGPARGVRAAATAASAPSASRSASRPAPVTDDTGTTGAPARPLPASSSATSSAARPSVSASTRSAFVSATTPASIAEEVADRGVLAGLRHHALVGGDDEERQVHARRARHHRAHERLVAGDVDDAEPQAAVELEGREAELDRDPARALLRQPVGVDPGERAHERGLPVVDVAGGAEDEGRHGALPASWLPTHRGGGVEWRKPHARPPCSALRSSPAAPPSSASRSPPRASSPAARARRTSFPATGSAALPRARRRTRSRSRTTARSSTP